MNYYYDIILNYQENYYMFYEWDEEDCFDIIKKIPIFHVSSQTITSFLYNIIKVDSSFLKLIENKTKTKQNTILLYSCIISDGKNNLALEFNKLGEVINKSSLQVEDEINLNEYICGIELFKINYKIIKYQKPSSNIRQEEKIKRILNIEINNMYKNKEYSKLKYIYLEWFNEINNDLNYIYNKMINKIKDNLTESEYHIYEIIKLSYNNV